MDVLGMFGVGWLSPVKLFFVRIPILSSLNQEPCECSESISKPTSGGTKAPPWGEVGALPIWRLAWNRSWFWASVPRPCSPPTGVGLIVGVNPRSSPQTLLMHRIHQSFGFTPQVAFIDDAGDDVFVSPIQNLIHPRNAGNPRHKPIAGHLIP